ncbi:hypothetical protein D050_4915 [Vibrio parahaemolyticus VPCR-2009]|nr:hypothetical protein D050_4915 [Vibrio parahaemolyticus VPCR-2009]
MLKMLEKLFKNKNLSICVGTRYDNPIRYFGIKLGFNETK